MKTEYKGKTIRIEQDEDAQSPQGNDDGGLFLTNSAPGFVLQTTPITATTVAVVGATIALTMGSRHDIVTLQPAP